MRHLSSAGASRGDFSPNSGRIVRSAAALIRQLLEANTAAFWMMCVADCDYIRALPTRKDAGRAADIPQLDHMATSYVVVFPPSLDFDRFP